MKNLRSIFCKGTLIVSLLACTACGILKPHFQSDQDLLRKFQEHEPIFGALAKQCPQGKDAPYSSPKEFTRPWPFLFWNCKFDKNFIVALQKTRVKLVSSDIRTNSRVVFQTDFQKEERGVIFGDTYVWEKGYLYTEKPIEAELIQTESLNSLDAQELVAQRKQEIWRYRKIKQNWYLFHRQYLWPSWAL
jgi:hypothetical protein